jgi:outer membrane protein OmpA-like peptidoglycan-associated protein
MNLPGTQTTTSKSGLSTLKVGLFAIGLIWFLTSCNPWPPFVIHDDRTGNKSMICFKKRCRRKTHQHNQRQKAAKERFKERQRRIARGDTLNKRVVNFQELVLAEEKKNVIVDEEVKEETFEPQWEELQTFVLDHIYFETNSADLKTESYDQLDELADWLTKHENSIIEISGHTDNTGDESFNVKLSKERVRSVGLYLIKVRGIKRNRLLAKGYGSSQPIADNNTEEGRSLNRRVEFTILKK